MSNLPILYATLEFLVFFPLGYQTARVWHEEIQPVLLPMFGIFVAMETINRDICALRLNIEDRA